MNREIKTLDGVMNLDDSNEVMPFTHHKEARNGVFKGSASEMHFTAIRGNSKVNNGTLAFNDCKLAGSALFTPNCNLEGAAVYVPKCELAGTATWIPVPITMSTTVSCTAYIGSGKIVVNNFAGGWDSFSFIAISTVSEADALLRLNASGTRFALTESSYTFQSLGNATYYIAIMDIGGLKGSTSATILCQPQPVSCILNHTCIEETGFSTVQAKTFTGGGGTFQISNILHTSSANALAGTFVDVSTATVEYTNVPDGTYYIALRDKANTSNKVAISVISDCVLTGDCSCFTVTNTTANRLDVVFFACNGSSTSRVVEANSPEYICVAGGTTPPAVTGLTITKCAPAVPCTTNTTCFQCGSTDPVWVDQNYNVCIDCTSYDVYKDVNPNSASAGKYRVNNIIGTTTAPTESACDTDADYSESMGTYHVCIGGQVNEYAIYKNTNTCFTGNQYSRGTSGTITYATNPVNDYPDTDRILVSQEFNYCYNCVTYLVYRDKNSCSPTWNEYFVNDTVSLGQTAPPAGDCSTATDWQSISETTCYECSNQTIYRDYGVCSPTKDKYRIGLTGPVSTTKPTVGNCVTTPSLTAQNYNTCYQCGNWAVFKDTNPCSSTYDRYILNQPPGTTFVNVGTTAPSNGNCVTTANWQNEGSRVCVDCTSYQPQRDINPCSSTYNNTRNADGVYGAAPCNTTTPSYTSPAGTLHYCTNGTVNTAAVMANTNACYSGMNTAQFRVDFGGGNYLYYGVGSNPANSYPDTTANWINRPIDQYWVCIGNVRYYEQIDINTCSPTAGQTRTGDMDGIVAGYCGYNPAVCTSYEVVNYDENYDLQVDYVACGGGATTDYIGASMTVTICAEEGTVSIGGFGSFTNVGSCSA